MSKSVKDGNLTQLEAQQIFDFAKDNNISASTIKPILIKNLNTLGRSIVVNEEQYQVIKQIIEYFGIANHEIELLSVKLDDYLAHRINANQATPNIVSSPIILEQDENCFFVLNVFTQKEKVVSKTIKGGSAGVSFRVAKGVTLRTGNFGGTITNNVQMVVDSIGQFILTNKRVIHLSDKQNIECDLDKLLSYQVYDDGIQINPRRGKSWQLYANHSFSSAYLLTALEFLINKKSHKQDFNSHIKIIESYDDNGNLLEASIEDEYYHNYEKAMEFKKSGNFLKACELLEKSVNPPNIYHGHYEQLFIMYRKLYKDDMKKGNYQAVIDRIQIMLRLNNELIQALNEYWCDKQPNFDGKAYSKIGITDLKTLLKAGQAINNENIIKNAEHLIELF